MVRGPAFYVPSRYTPPFALHLLARALLQRPARSLPLLPEGEARLEALGRRTIEVAGRSRTVRLQASHPARMLTSSEEIQPLFYVRIGAAQLRGLTPDDDLGTRMAGVSVGSDEWKDFVGPLRFHDVVIDPTLAVVEESVGERTPHPRARGARDRHTRRRPRHGMDDELGSIEPGKLADLILVDGDPPANISDIRRVLTVIEDGRVYDPAAIYRALGIEPCCEELLGNVIRFRRSDRPHR